ncbi:Hypothetical protein SRAE_X000029500 [Strongyloides ratti]|uniref:Uncharacterized protein n=1 Tax=Strongyloides ratti TaxID=34506 RepID=A0A090LRX8_STRRB|nr:Hypothetical protein SRAE_X000029500 [Strongyloides ratti]CEF70967.1 Hypothetical protein SRAE_X000029500 [Strongyloides ratti]
MDDLLGEILGQVQATTKAKPVAKEYKSAKRIAEEREIAEYEAERKERSERNKIFELKAKERALDARIREAVKKNKGRVTARMSKEFGMDLLIMQERYGSDVDVLRKLQNEKEKDNLTTDWQCDKFAHGALKAQKLREQLSKNKKITAAAKTSKKAINFDEMVEDLASREKRKSEAKKEAQNQTKISQGQNLSFIDILKKATLNKSEKGETSKQVEKSNRIDKEKEKKSLDYKKSSLTSHSNNDSKYSNNFQKIEKKYPSNEQKIKDDKKQSYNISNKLDDYRHKTLTNKEDYSRKMNDEKIKSQISHNKNNINTIKNVSKIIPSISTNNKHLSKTDGHKSNVSDIFKRPSEKRREMKELEKNSSKSLNNKGNKKSDIEMDKIRALQERERKKQEIFKAMREVEILRNKETELYNDKKKDKKLTPKEKGNNYKIDRNFENGRKRSHGMFDKPIRKKNKRSYDDNYVDDYDSEDSLADFIDDEFEEEVPDRKTMKEALRGIAKNYDRARWRENERRINDRDMISSFRDIDREERKSLKIGYQEDLEEAKKGSEAL